MYYRTFENYKKYCNVLYQFNVGLFFIIIFLSVALLGRAFYGAPESNSYIKGVDGKLEHFIEINYNNEFSLFFIHDAITELFNLSSDNINQLNNKLVYLDDNAKKQYFNILSAIKVLPNIQKEPLILTSKENESYQLIKNGVGENVHFWVYQIKIEHDIKTKQNVNKYIINYNVYLRSTNKKSLGLEIYKIEVKN